MKGGTLQSIQRSGTGGALRIVEASEPGFRVIAGPFHVDHPSIGADEQRQAREAVKLQAAAGCPHKAVKYRGMVFVLRSAEGWKIKVAGSEDFLEENRTLTPLRNGQTGRGRA